jgi:hypothetical protein
MRTLILNSNNIVPNTNNSVLEYNFPAGSVYLEDMYVALATVTMYYSTFNITAANNNNFVQYRWFDNLLYDVTFPNGFYSVTDIQNYIRSVMLTNKHYLVDAVTGDVVWFFSMTTNPSTYSVQMNFFPCNSDTYPSADYTNPSTGTATAWVVPTSPTSYCPQLYISGSSNFGLLIGFNSAQAYPTSRVTSVAVSVLSSFAPQITPLSSYILSCSLANNNFAVPNTFLYCFAPQGTIGDQFTIQPYQYSFISVLKGSYSSFRCQFTDQNNRPVSLQDPNIVIMLILAEKEEVRGSK